MFGKSSSSTSKGTQIQDLTLIWILSTTCNSSFMESDALFWSPQSPGMHACMYMCCTYIYAVKTLIHRK